MKVLQHVNPRCPRTQWGLNIPSRSKRSGSQNKALANANRILHPPEKVFVAKCCLSSENPRPARILAARDSALSDSISDSLAWMSLNVLSSPSRCRSSFSASVDVSAMEDRSASISASCLIIFYHDISTEVHYLVRIGLPLAQRVGVCATHPHPALLAKQAYHRQ